MESLVKVTGLVHNRRLYPKPNEVTEKKHHSNPPTATQAYPDKSLWLFFYPLIAFSYIFIANDNPYSDLIRIPSFTTDIVFALLVTYLIGWYIKYLIRKLDISISRDQISKRIRLQLLLGVILPLLFAIGLEILYLYLINIPLDTSSVFNLELPLTFIFLISINLFYISGYFFHNKKVEIVTIIEKIPAHVNDMKFITTQKGYKEEKISISDCAYIKTADKIVWLYTYNGVQFRLSGTLEEWETQLGTTFFKINRQYLVAAASIKSVEQTETRKLKVSFFLPQEEDVFISKTNTTNFRKWWKQDCPF